MIAVISVKDACSRMAYDIAMYVSTGHPWEEQHISFIYQHRVKAELTIDNFTTPSPITVKLDRISKSC
jgi:hypothetical protein